MFKKGQGLLPENYTHSHDCSNEKGFYWQGLQPWKNMFADFNQANTGFVCQQVTVHSVLHTLCKAQQQGCTAISNIINSCFLFKCPIGEWVETVWRRVSTSSAATLKLRHAHGIQQFLLEFLLNKRLFQTWLTRSSVWLNCKSRHFDLIKCTRRTIRDSISNPKLMQPSLLSLCELYWNSREVILSHYVSSS